MYIPEVFIMAIGENIRRLRLQRGLSQEELAALIGYSSKSTINKIEQGTRGISHNKITKFAEILGTTPSELIGWNNNANAKKSPMTQDEQQQFINRYNQAPEYIRKAVLKLLDIE